MDYKSYKAMCDSTLQQIRESENKREELNNKLQKMYQEKSECEKSIIKTLQSQQKQFMDEKRRRAERNENILRTLERIDYQAQLLASKTERLRALKRQYERYLLSLWTTRKATETTSLYSLPQNLKTIGTQQKPFTAKYDESPIHQSSYYSATAAANKVPAFVTDLRPSNYLLNTPAYISMSPTSPITAHTYPNNQSLYREVPLTLEDSIKSGNYHRIGSKSPETISSYVQPQQMLRYGDYSAYLQQPRANDNAINIPDMNQPTTINSIYYHTDLHQQSAPQLPLVEKSSLSIYNQQQEYQSHNNYNSDRSMKMSKAYHDIPLIMPSVGSGSAVSTTDFIPQQKIPQMSSVENRLNDNNKKNHDSIFNPENSIHMTDVDTDDSGSCIEGPPKMTFLHEKLDVPQNASMFADIKFSDTNVQQTYEKSSGLGFSAGVLPDPSDTNSDTKSINNKETPVIPTSSPSDLNTNAMHQVWEKVIEAEPTTPPSAATAVHGSFVIPKIIVETQIDLTETTTAPVIATTTGQSGATDIATATTLSKMDVNEKQDRDIPEKLLNQTRYEMEKHSSDNRQNESISSSTSVSYDNSPLTDTAMSIYHYDKQSADNRNTQQPQSSVEYELRNFDDMKISSLSDGNNDDTRPCERADDIIKGNNSSLDMTTTVSTASTIPINNINDDKIPKSSSTMALNDRIGEIYRKIEKIEDEYYGEKGKIMENFEMRRLSGSSLSNDEAKIESIKDDASETVPKQQQNQQEYDQNTNDDMKQVDDDDDDKNLISKNEWESNQSEYAAVEQANGNETNLYEPQVDDQSNYNYYQQENQDYDKAEEQQQQQPVEYSENPQFTQMYEQNQQSMFENREFAVPAAPFEDEGINNNSNNGAGDYQTSAVKQYSYEPTDSNIQYLQNDQYDPMQSQRQEYPYEPQLQHQQMENPYEQQENVSFQQVESDANNFNPYNQQQLESNYESSNYIETSVDDQNSSNYGNDSVYYDYVGTQNQNYSSDVIDVHPQQTMYDDQNYTHQMTQEEYERSTMAVSAEGNEVVERNEYFTYQNNDNNIEGNMYQDHSNENNYDGTDSRTQQMDIETSNEMNANVNEEYQTNIDGSYANTTADLQQMPLENANYETQHLVQESGNENIELYNRNDDSYHEGMTESQSDVSSSQPNDMDMIGENVVTSTKRDDIKLVKQLLDSESSDDPNSARSSLLKTAIKEEVDESDFDFSAN